jgi:hypothetical protein
MEMERETNEEAAAAAISISVMRNLEKIGPLRSSSNHARGHVATTPKINFNCIRRLLLTGVP